MSYTMTDVGKFGDGGLGSLTPTKTGTIINGYANVTGISGNTITLGEFYNADKFTVGTKIIVQVAYYTGTATDYRHLGRFQVTTINAIGDNNTLTVGRKCSGLLKNGAHLQIITLPEYTTVTLNEKTSITALKFDKSKGYGGVVAFKCSERLVFNGGHIDLNGKGLPEASMRYLLPHEKDSAFEGFENYRTSTRNPLNYPDGAAFIIAQHMTCNLDSRIGNPDVAGLQRTPSYRDHLNQPLDNRIFGGGANIFLAAEEISGVDLNYFYKMISKTPSIQTGVGKAGCCVITESRLPSDEGTYSCIRPKNENRMTETFKIISFGDGSNGKKTNEQKQLNSYAVIRKINNKERSVFTIGTPDNSGVAKIATGSLVMIHTLYNGKHRSHVGRFQVATVLEYSQGIVTVDVGLEKLSNWDLDHYAFQMIAIPQYTNFTLSKENNATRKLNKGMGGICAVAVNDTLDLSGGKFNVEGKGASFTSAEAGGAASTGSAALNYISNAQMAEKLPVGEGNGSVFILAKNLILNSSSRIGATWSGKAYGGTGRYTDSKNVWSNYASGNDVLYNGSGKAGGKFSSNLDGGGTLTMNGGFYSNASSPDAYSYETGGTRRPGAYQGAHILIVADKITGLSLANLSTGGQASTLTGQIYKKFSNGDKVTSLPATNGGCGMGGGSAWVKSNVGNLSHGGYFGGFIGGAAGDAFNDSTQTFRMYGAGSGSFCFVYCNQAVDQDTDYLLDT